MQREAKWNPPLLVVVEEAASYDCLPLVRRGRHYGIQAILVSQDPLSGETRTNTRTITGANDPTITEKVDPSIAFAAQQLSQGEWDLIVVASGATFQSPHFDPFFQPRSIKIAGTTAANRGVDGV